METPKASDAARATSSRMISQGQAVNMKEVILNGNQDQF
jgi:hypothetical protein